MEKRNIKETAMQALIDLDMEDEQLACKIEAVILIKREMKKLSLNQIEYAKLIGWQQSNLSALLSGGKFDSFSLARINEALEPADQKIRTHYAVEPTCFEHSNGKHPVAAE